MLGLGSVDLAEESEKNQCLDHEKRERIVKTICVVMNRLLMGAFRDGEDSRRVKCKGFFGPSFPLTFPSFRISKLKNIQFE
jgi:hypothetical protein